MSVAIQEVCQLCGLPASLFEHGSHAGCRISEDFLSEYLPDGDGSVCDLCGKPAMSFERRTHADCAAREKMISDM